MKNMTKKHIMYVQKPEIYAICYMNNRTIYYNLAADPKAKIILMKKGSEAGVNVKTN